MPILALAMMSEAADAPARLLRFEDEMNACIAACLDHIRTEEVEILQLAERVLTGAAWAERDAAFRQDRDPLTRRDGANALRRSRPVDVALDTP
jgi:hypothetical protein